MSTVLRGFKAQGSLRGLGEVHPVIYTREAYRRVYPVIYTREAYTRV